MSEESFTIYKEVFDENSEPTDKGEEKEKHTYITECKAFNNSYCMSHH